MPQVKWTGHMQRRVRTEEDCEVLGVVHMRRCTAGDRGFVECSMVYDKRGRGIRPVDDLVSIILGYAK